MIKVENLSYSYPQKDLYKDITFTLEEGQHCALIGTCGTGKSTLIDILMNPDDYMFTGKLEMEKNCRIGYVSQFPQIDREEEITVSEYLAKDFVVLQTKIADICKQLETSEEYEVLLEEYQNAMDAFDAMDGDNYEINIAKKLSLAELERYASFPIAKLSGGEFKLVQIIKEMLTLPHLMIMDEPDVFLDFERLKSLKNLIQSYQGTILVITHNRYLLNHCFNKILHLENNELQEFDGGYIDYNFNLYLGKIEKQELAIKDEEEIERNIGIVNKFQDNASKNSSSSLGRALKGRKTILERLLARQIKAPFVEIHQPDIHFTTDCPLTDEVMIKATDYCISFQDILLEDVNFEIMAQDKVAIIGENGTGKSTLLWEIFKNNNSAIKLNENAEIGVLSQNQSQTLNGSNTVLEEFMEMGFETYTKVENFLYEFGIGEDMLGCRIDTLSGGERNLLQLAKISAGNANLLLLDEPTSHLDTYSQIALETAIANYNGTVIMVSHDFYSIVNSIDYVLFIENKTIRKMSMRAFRKMMYAKHFDQKYLEFEKLKKQVETKIELALQDRDFQLAQKHADELEVMIKTLG